MSTAYPWDYDTIHEDDKGLSKLEYAAIAIYSNRKVLTIKESISRAVELLKECEKIEGAE